VVDVLVVRAREEGEGSVDGGVVWGEGGGGARRVEKSSSLAMRSSRDWIVESPRWREGVSSESESAGGWTAFPLLVALASLMIASSAEFASGGPEYFNGAWV